jgi:hypothetical protein
MPLAIVWPAPDEPFGSAGSEALERDADVQDGLCEHIGYGKMRAVSATWDEAIQRFREVGGRHRCPLVRTYVVLLESARARWQSIVAVHPWRLDLLDLTARRASPRMVQAEFRVRDGRPVVHFDSDQAGRCQRLGPAKGPSTSWPATTSIATQTGSSQFHGIRYLTDDPNSHAPADDRSL